MKLSEDSLIPLYQQIINDIREGIEDGRYAVGQKIPSEAELSEMYKVSRITIRRAIEELSIDGYLTKKQGKGTYVNPPKLEKKMVQSGPLQSFTEVCEKSGRVPGARVVARAREKATEEIAKALGLSTDDEVIVTKRVRLADNVPILLEVSAFPAKDYAFMETEGLDNASLYDILAHHDCRVPVGMSNAVVDMAHASEWVAQALSVRVGEPLFREVGVFVDAQDEPVFYGKLLIVGTQYSFHI